MEYSPFKSLFRRRKLLTCHISSGPTENHQSQTRSQNPASPFSCPTSCPALGVKYRGSYRWHGLGEKVTIDYCPLHFFSGLSANQLTSINILQQSRSLCYVTKLKFKPFPLVWQCEESHPTGSHFCRLTSPGSSLWALQPSRHWPGSTNRKKKVKHFQFLCIPTALYAEFASLFKNSSNYFTIYSSDLWVLNNLIKPPN